MTAGREEALEEGDGHTAHGVLPHLACWEPSWHGQKTHVQPADASACERCDGIRHEGSGKGGDRGSRPDPIAPSIQGSSLYVMA